MKSKEEIEEDKLDKAIQEKVINIVKRREQMMTGGENGSASDFLGSLIKASHDPDVKKRVSQQEIIDECKTFYNSGQDTTTSLLSWAALLLAIHTDWQDKARTEVLEVFGRENPSPEGISKLKTVIKQIHNSNSILFDTHTHTYIYIYKFLICFFAFFVLSDEHDH